MNLYQLFFAGENSECSSRWVSTFDNDADDLLSKTLHGQGCTLTLATDNPALIAKVPDAFHLPRDAAHLRTAACLALRLHVTEEALAAACAPVTEPAPATPAPTAMAVAMAAATSRPLPTVQDIKRYVLGYLAEAEEQCQQGYTARAYTEDTIGTVIQYLRDGSSSLHGGVPDLVCSCAHEAARAFGYWPRS